MPDSGIYTVDEKGIVTLIAVDADDTVTEFEVRPGTDALAKDVFRDHPRIKKLILPSSLTVIPEGTLSNGGGWSSEDKGIDEIVLDETNTAFCLFDGFFCEKGNDHSLKLLRYIGKSEHVILPLSITQIGEKAFTDRMISSVHLERAGCTIWFPKNHQYYLNVLLEEFGKNGKIYDFTRYDKFLLDNHFNIERIRMTCERLKNAYELTSEGKERLKTHLLENEENILEALLASGKPDTLEILAEIGFFKAGNIDAIIDSVNRTARTDLLSWLINYKQEHIGRTEYDFDL